MKKKSITLVREFLRLFEEVFDNDWEYTKSMLGIHDETPEQRKNAEDMGFETIHLIDPNGTFKFINN